MGRQAQAVAILMKEKQRTLPERGRPRVVEQVIREGVLEAARLVTWFQGFRAHPAARWDSLPLRGPCQHLVTFCLGEEDGVHTVEDAARKLAVMDSQGRVWAQEMLLRVSPDHVTLLDHVSKVPGPRGGEARPDGEQPGTQSVALGTRKRGGGGGLGVNLGFRASLLRERGQGTPPLLGALFVPSYYPAVIAGEAARPCGHCRLHVAEPRVPRLSLPAVPPHRRSWSRIR